MGTLSPEVAAFVTEALPALQSLVAWWQERQRLAEQASTPERQLIRQTYHVEKRFVGLIKQEADLRRTTYAHVLNDALTQYFLGHRP
jgi:hypothetical protein